MPTVAGFAAFAADLATKTEGFSEELVARFYAEDFDLLIHDSQVPWARVAADYLGLPRIVSTRCSHRRSEVNDDHDQDLVHPDPVQAQATFEADLALDRPALGSGRG